MPGGRPARGSTSTEAPRRPGRPAEPGAEEWSLGQSELPGDAGPRTTPAPVSRRVLDAHWWLLQSLLRLLGFGAHSGWPPRWSRFWAVYAYVLIAVGVLTVYMIHMFGVSHCLGRKNTSYRASSCLVQ